MKIPAIALLIMMLAGCAAPAAQSPQRQQPKVVAMPVPAYPDSLKERGIGGDVVVDFDVGPDGRAHNVAIVSSPDPALSAAVQRATDDWRFIAATVDGQPVTTHLRVPIGFDPKTAK